MEMVRKRVSRSPPLLLYYYIIHHMDLQGKGYFATYFRTVDARHTYTYTCTLYSG